MGLTGKILLFIAALVVLLVGGTLAFTAVQADRLARTTIDAGLKETRDVWQTIQADRFNKLKLGVRVLANDPYFKAALAERDQATTLDSLGERGQDLAADFMMATDPAGALVARTDRPSASGDDLSGDPMVKRALEGEDSATLWRQGDELFTAVAVPMQTGPELVGVLVAGYGLDEAVASQIRKLTHSEIAFLVQAPGQEARLAVSSLGPREAALAAAVSRPELARADGTPFEIDLDGDRHIGVRIPLKAATGEEIGAALALRSLSAETASFRQFRNSLVLVSLGVTALGLLAAWGAAARITGPVRKLVSLVERVREGSYTGSVAVQGRDEIGVLARAFNGLLADLREKDQMISFLRDGMTAMRQATATTPAPTAGAPACGPGLAHGSDPLGGRADGRDAGRRGDRRRGRPRPRAGVRRPLRGPRHARQGRHGRRLPRPRPAARRGGGAQAPPARGPRRRPDAPRALQAGAEARAPHHPPERPAHPRLRRDGRHPLHLDGVRRRGDPEGGRPQPGRPPPRGRPLDRQADVPRAGGGPRRRRRPPRHQAPQHADPPGDGRAEDHGLRHLARLVGRARIGGAHHRGHRHGDPDYMPPEQAQGRPADFRSDLYSLAVVLFEIFTGKLPFKGDNPMAVVVAHIQQAPPRPRSLNPKLPPELESAIVKGLQKDPAKRWQSADELLEALSAISARSEAA